MEKGAGLPLTLINAVLYFPYLAFNFIRWIWHIPKFHNPERLACQYGTSGPPPSPTIIPTVTRMPRMQGLPSHDIEIEGNLGSNYTVSCLLLQVFPFWEI